MEGAGIRRIDSVPEADALLPTEFGDFRIRAFRDPADGKEHAVLYVGDLTSGSPWFESTPNASRATPSIPFAVIAAHNSTPR